MSNDTDDTPPERSPAYLRSCDEAVAELFTYLDGALTEARRALIRSHLDQCGPCFEAFEFHIELRTVIQKRCHTELPSGLKERIFDQVMRSGLPPESGLGR